jgi:NhaP-type Na+/H+ or K+/H+ antiporter
MLRSRRWPRGEEDVNITIWFVITGVLLIGMALGGSVLRRLPLTTSILYLAVGIVLGPYGFGLLDVDPVGESELLHRLAELAVIVSLFTAGLKLRINWRDSLWHLPLRLATISMVLTVGLVAVTGMVILGLSAGAAILLGAVLAPTDPVLAAEVEVDSPRDQDRLRFSLTGEAGFNDGTAFPFVMLGLGVLGLHHLGAFGWRWISVDLAWAVLGGLGIGALLGTVVGHLVVYLRRTHAEAIGRDEFLTLGLIALAYGVALLFHTYGFLAVFAAGLAVRRVEHRLTGKAFDEAIEDLERQEGDVATGEGTAPLHMAEEVLGFNERLGRIGEVALVVIVGSLLSADGITAGILFFIPVLFLVVRPVAVLVGLSGTDTNLLQRALVAWFGIRGIGSIYNLMYATDHDLAEGLASELVTITVTVVAASIVVHGVSVTPLMNRYEAARKREGAA